MTHCAGALPVNPQERVNAADPPTFALPAVNKNKFGLPAREREREIKRELADDS